ncbi:uncharacterized protein TNCV_1322241 [Trichonephila clavipes]|nr:uncharacterized protein TNCV_1322241 [Trichonephila clavipes]
MTGHIYRDVILEQHVRLLRGAMGAEFLFMGDNARPHRANIVDECLQSEDITRMDCPAYSLDLNPIEHVWNMLGENLLHRIHPNNWSQLRRKYPNINISFRIVEIATLEKFQTILPPTTQISSFNYRCGLSLQSEENLRRHAVSIIQYLNSTFFASLNEIHLEFGFVNIPHLEGAVHDLVRSCKWLQVFTLSGVLKADLAIKVSEMALQEESGDIHLYRKD